MNEKRININIIFIWTLDKSSWVSVTRSVMRSNLTTSMKSVGNASLEEKSVRSGIAEINEQGQLRQSKFLGRPILMTQLGP